MSFRKVCEEEIDKMLEDHKRRHDFAKNKYTESKKLEDKLYVDAEDGITCFIENELKPRLGFDKKKEPEMCCEDD